MLKVSLGSKVTPKIFGFLLVGTGVLFIVSCGVILSSELSLVKRVIAHLSGFSCRLFAVAHV